MILETGSDDRPRGLGAVLVRSCRAVRPGPWRSNRVRRRLRSARVAWRECHDGVPERAGLILDFLAAGGWISMEDPFSGIYQTSYFFAGLCGALR